MEWDRPTQPCISPHALNRPVLSLPEPRAFSKPSIELSTSGSRLPLFSMGLPMA